MPAHGGPWTPGLQLPIPWSGVDFMFTDYVGLTKDPHFADNILYLLLEQGHLMHMRTSELATHEKNHWRRLLRVRHGQA